MSDNGPDKYEEFRAAMHAVRSAAAGKSRDEVRALLVTELVSRGLNVGPDKYLEAYVTRIISAPTPKTAPGAAAHRRPPSRLLMPVRGIQNAKRVRDLLPQYQPGHRVRFLPPIGPLNRSR
jgi:hypothetical protein